MWLSTSLAALWLATCALAKTPETSAHTDENGIRSIPLRTHTLAAPYLDSDMQSRWWDFGGNTIIRADQYIRLTSDRPSQEGWIFSRVPLTATNWEIELEFKLHGAGNLHGDGFALWVTKQRATPGPVFGHADKFEGLGIFFDTYKNNRPGTVFPYVMAMIGDGTKPYDKSNDGKDNEAYGCSARGIRGASIPTRARLTYFQDKSLKLELMYKVEDQWELCFETNEPPAIPQVAYLGFSAETGELSDNHDIISVHTKNLYDTKSRPDHSGSKNPSGPDSKNRGGSTKPKGSWSWFFFKIILFFLVIGGAYVGYTAWRTQQRKSHRF
ncbi:concanavalin A-like lectin/glucanase domain-containing protein [Bisporella sp. PMI_857]|nr:concanavalin A-like lectin/glucanase domain-containing protein [Bisporella sp. PMI_857]